MRDVRHTVAFGQLLRADGIVLGRIQLDRHLGREALGFFFVFNHFEGFSEREREKGCVYVLRSSSSSSSGGGLAGLTLRTDVREETITYCGGFRD